MYSAILCRYLSTQFVFLSFFSYFAVVYLPDVKSFCSNQVLGRTLQVVVSLGSFCFDLFIDQRNDQINKNKRKRAIEFRTKLTNLGPTFVKVGQGLSTRPDLCPPEYLEELAELQVSHSKLMYAK
jgi:predicted unusual protein kinase regulating ubiquinone biosynthesis (AarF/ABC1/UbiB family)